MKNMKNMKNVFKILSRKYDKKEKNEFEFSLRPPVLPNKVKQLSKSYANVIKPERKRRIVIIFHSSADVKKPSLRFVPDHSESLKNIGSDDPSVLLRSLFEMCKAKACSVEKKTRKNVIDIDAAVRFRHSTEENIVIEKVDIEEYVKTYKTVVFRNMTRLTFKLEYGNLDISSIGYDKNGNLPTKLYDCDKRGLINRFEVEFELNSKGEKNIDKAVKSLESIQERYEDLYSYVSVVESDNVAGKYKELTKSGAYISTNVKSLQRGEFSSLFQEYAVSVKADGENMFLYYVSGNCYSINSRMRIKKENNTLGSAYDDTLIQCEYIKSGETRLFLPFDVLFLKKIDMRSRFYTERYKKLNELFQDKLGIYSNSISNIFCKREFRISYTSHCDNVKQELDLGKKCAYFVKPVYFSNGSERGDIYDISHFLLQSYKENNTPYGQDGLIFTPYGSYFKTPLKYKTLDVLSVDVYVKIERDFKNDFPYVVFDKKSENTYYNIVNFFVGKTSNKKGKEYPTPLIPDKLLHKGNIVLDRQGVLRSTDGEIIHENTVVEVVFNLSNEREVQDSCRILRTRWDKTERVWKSGKGYGNYYTVAENIIRSIEQYIPPEEFKLFSLNKGTLAGDRLSASRKYYRVKTDYASHMRAFHNFIKESLISKYTKPGGNVADMGCGVGGDVEKYTRAELSKVVMVDQTDGGFHGPGGLYSRIENIKRRFKKYPDFYPIVVNFSKTFSDQNGANMHILNTKRPDIDSVFYAFSFHYNAGSISLMKTALKNCSQIIKRGGYIVITTMNAHKVFNLLKKSNEGTASFEFIDKKGEKVELFRIKSMFKETSVNKLGFGRPISIYNGIFMEKEQTEIEYLVPHKTLVDLMKKFQFSFVEKRDFEQMHDKKIITRMMGVESNMKLKNRYKKISDFFNSTEENTELSVTKKWSNLNCYYIFKKN